jgi:beta-lactam-binding protein with PASTA domain
VFSAAWLDHVSGATSTPLVTIPVTYGERASEAITHIEAAGLTVATNPARSPAHAYFSVGSSPEGGRKVPKGSHVVLNVRQA